MLVKSIIERRIPANVNYRPGYKYNFCEKMDVQMTIWRRLPSVANLSKVHGSISRPFHYLKAAP
jgi:hypothetical protein